jgi:nicotinamidase-related amidase
MSDRTALLVIDMQIGLVEGAYRADAVLDRIAELIGRARRAGVPVIHVQHHHSTYAPLKAGAPTWHLHPRVAPAEGECVIGKTASDAFYETPLWDELRRLEVTHVVVTGMQTELCVDTTCRRAITLGLDVTLASDAHTTVDAMLPAESIVAYHNAVLPRLAHPRRHILVRPSRDVTFGYTPAP